jgi:hypothetical protein
MILRKQNDIFDLVKDAEQMADFGWSGFGAVSGSDFIGAGVVIVNTALGMAVLLKDKREYS